MRRLAAAVALMALALLACLGIDVASRQQQGPGDAAVPAGNVWARSSDQGVASSMFSRLADPPATSSVVPPEVRAEVLGGFDQADEELYARDTVGLLLPCAADEAQRSVAAALASCGWTSVGEVSAAGRGLTFVKQQGLYRWLFMQVVEQAGSTTVVLTLQKESAHG